MEDSEILNLWMLSLSVVFFFLFCSPLLEFYRLVFNDHALQFQRSSKLNNYKQRSNLLCYIQPIAFFSRTSSLFIFYLARLCIPELRMISIIPSNTLRIHSPLQLGRHLFSFRYFRCCMDSQLKQLLMLVILQGELSNLLSNRLSQRHI